MIEVFATKLFGTLLSDIYKRGGGFFSQKLKARISQKSIEKAYERIANLSKVKTLWSMDSPIDIDEFFIPPNLSKSSSPTSEECCKVSDFTSRNCIIRGPAGQGKSIFLRYLCVKELSIAENVPIFIELRKANIGTDKNRKEIGLETLIQLSLDLMGLPNDDYSLNKNMDSNKFVLMLDGFDELIPELQKRMLKDIEAYCQKHLKLRIILTSRPGTSILNSPFFIVYDINPLSDKEIFSLIDKLVDNNKKAEKLINSLKKNRKIKDLVKTPLIVVMLIIVYNSNNSIPKTMSEFYEELFIVLLRRHDQTKAGFVRHRESGINDLRFYNIFCVLCFLSAKEKKIEMNEMEMSELISRSLKKEMIDDVNPIDYLHDITNITNLILQDGIYYIFVHRSIQEYFAAKYIAKSLDSDAEKFYSIIQTRPDLIEVWRQSLEFLKEIDKYRYIKYYYLPSVLASGLFDFDINDENSSVFLPKNIEDCMNARIKIKRNIKSNHISPKYVYSIEISLTLSKYFDSYNDTYLTLVAIIKRSTSKLLEQIDFSKNFSKLKSDSFEFLLFEDEKYKTQIYKYKTQIYMGIENASEYISLKDSIKKELKYLSNYENERSISKELENI